ncbi:ATPase AAA [Nocardiopsis terrae]|uniref:MoxR-like ATPase n=1 Tax=Nocardiopsis terrae TaxID=372655 RepID=A0ABR9HNI2_9ACTN|nr:AAA family ATPase [Nocardiopsis terrae]MBE1460546.1 MoxR-like ATPase [Nocardiopsis terrae]GHC72018.1 ATPase AAA [Nocardiopsis terrae]
MSAPTDRDPSAPPPPPEWWLFRGTGTPRPQLDLGARLRAVPPWRVYGGGPHLPPPPGDERGDRLLGTGHRTDDGSRPADPARLDLLDKVNAALYLRRPLLLSGPPGVGKSSLAHQIARELGLGRVLVWSVNSTATVRTACYVYDPISRIHDINLDMGRADPEAPGADGPRSGAQHIGRYLTLGPVGTAFLPQELPRVLLVDDFDLGDFDLAGDLLDLFENGEFPIPELERLSGVAETIEVGTHDPGRTAPVTRGRVVCSAFPIVILTCNSERELPQAFMRRCIPAQVGLPSEEELLRMVARHFRGDPPPVARQLVEEFLQRSATGRLSVDQLLNAVQLVATTSPGVKSLDSKQMDHLKKVVWHYLTEPAG